MRTSNSSNVKSATFTSVWDGDTAITTNCKVNVKTHRVFDIKRHKGNVEGLDCLDRQYVTVDDIDYPVVEKDDYDHSMTNTFWYR